MSFRAVQSVCLALLSALPLAACNQLEAIDETDGGGGGGGIPPAVRQAFTESCGRSGCHASGGVTPTLAGDALDGILTAQADGIPLVTIGDTSNSYLAIVMMPDDVLAALGLTRTVARMPFGGPYDDPNLQTILAWIGGAEFPGGGGETTDGGGTDGGTDGGSTGGDPGAPTFANVQKIFTAQCGCHATPAGPGNGNLNLGEGMAYANIVDVKSPTVMMDLVEPNDPTKSYLYLKMTGTFDAVPGATGAKMPLGGMVSADDLTLIEEWISMGALDN